MKIANSKKLAGCLVNEATCRKKLGKEIADSLFKLMNQLRKIVDVKQLFELPGNFHRLRHLPIDNVYAVTLKHPSGASCDWIQQPLQSRLNRFVIIMVVSKNYIENKHKEEYENI